MALLFVRHNARTTLATSCSSSATTITVADRTKLPTSYPYGLLIEGGTPQEEVVTATANGAGANDIVVTRGQDGTVGVGHTASLSTFVDNVITAGGWNAFKAAIDTSLQQGGNTFGADVAVGANDSNGISFRANNAAAMALSSTSLVVTPPLYALNNTSLAQSRVAFVNANGNGGAAGGNSVRFGHSNTGYHGYLGGLSSAGYPFFSAYAYHGPTSDRMRRTSGTNIPTWFDVDTTGAWTWHKDTAGTVDTDVSTTPLTQMSLSGAGRLSVAAGVAGILLADVPIVTELLLNSSTNATGGGGLALTASSTVWTNFGSPVTFTPTTAGLLWQIAIGGFFLYEAGGTAEFGSRLLVTPAVGTAFVIPGGGDAAVSGAYGNAASGSTPQFKTGLTNQVYSCQAQVQTSANGTLYVRGNQGELLNITVLEYKRAA